MKITPQKGFQEKALSTPADIAIIGGSAGGGKTWILLAESARHVANPKFGGVIFRRTTPMITNQGGLWDASFDIYPHLGATPLQTRLRWAFPSKASIKFAHMEYEKNMYDWQGTEIPFLGFDELTHFSEAQFFYLLSRNRSTSGIKPYVRATCNPDPSSWVRSFIDWWIDENGFPIPERCGRLRYMVRDGDVIVWGNSPAEVRAQCPHIFSNPELIASGVNLNDLVKSVTFIPGGIYDNKILIRKDPGYLGNLLSLGTAEKSQLLDGNWNVSLDGLELFTELGIRDIFTNYTEQAVRPLKCITCDAARFGRDLCVIAVWKGWEVIHLSVFKKSDVHDIVKHIEELRRKHLVTKSNVIVDQDGVGGGTVAIGDYTGFHGGHKALKDPETRKVENYKNLKTQCFYRFAERRVNTGLVRVNVNSETCLIFDDSALTGVHSTKIKVGGAVKDIRDLIKEDLRAIKRAKIDIEGKFCINTKEEQKIILKRSPDFGDTLMMREYLELLGDRKTMKRMN